MPNRIIKESITTSEKLASLSDFEFRLWIGLITQADDAGRGDARPAVIKGRVRDCKPKYPEPTDDSLRQVAADCGEARQSAAIIQSNPIQSESESEYKGDSARALRKLRILSPNVIFITSNPF